MACNIHVYSKFGFGPYTKFEYVNKKHMTSATCTKYVQ